MLKRFLEWFWFRGEKNYKDPHFPLRIVRIRGFRSFLMDNYPNKTSRAGISIILPWEKYGSWRTR